jgi:hypothetical protein
MLTKPSAELTLFDTLSRLTFVRATKLLMLRLRWSPIRTNLRRSNASIPDTRIFGPVVGVFQKGYASL